MASNEREFCRICSQWFSDWEAFFVHKIQSKSHIACYICGRDFKTQEGCTRHQIQEHAAEQELSCIGCSKHFVRVGAYISHIEQHRCRVIHKEDFDRRRDEKELWHNATKPGDMMIGQTTLHLDKLVRPANNNGRTCENWSSVTLSIDPKAPNLHYKEFPLLPPMIYRNGGCSVPEASNNGLDDANLGKYNWNKEQNLGKTLFPDAPDAVKPPVDASTALILKKDVGSRKDRIPPSCDPDHPDFNPADLYNPYSQKYRCPWADCRKMQSHVQGLHQHLRSPAHTNERLRCPGCLRIFNSATALVQHAESQAVRCSIRDSEKYRQAVDQITGGLVDVRGRNSDDTVRYVASQDVKLSRVRESEELYWENLENERKELIRKQEENLPDMKW